jgi:hypothetical protein
MAEGKGYVGLIKGEGLNAIVQLGLLKIHGAMLFGQLMGG